VPVDGVVAHPGVLTLNVEVEVAGGEGLEVPAEDSLELPVGGDLDGDGGLVLLEGVLGPLDGGGEVLSAGQLGRLADPPRAPLEVHNGQLLSVEDNTPEEDNKLVMCPGETYYRCLVLKRAKCAHDFTSCCQWW